MKGWIGWKDGLRGRIYQSRDASHSNSKQEGTTEDAKETGDCPADSRSVKSSQVAVVVIYCPGQQQQCNKLNRATGNKQEPV